MQHHPSLSHPCQESSPRTGPDQGSRSVRGMSPVFGAQKFTMRLTGAETKGSAGLWSFWGEAISLPFAAPGSCLRPWLLAPHHSSLFFHHPIPSDSDPPTLL